MFCRIYQDNHRLKLYSDVMTRVLVKKIASVACYDLQNHFGCAAWATAVLKSYSYNIICFVCTDRIFWDLIR